MIEIVARRYKIVKRNWSIVVHKEGHVLNLLARHTRHFGDGKVFPVFIWIFCNWNGASQSGVRQPIRTYFSEATEALYGPMHGASRGVEHTSMSRCSSMACPNRLGMLCDCVHMRDKQSRNIGIYGRDIPTPIGATSWPIDLVSPFDWKLVLP